MTEDFRELSVVNGQRIRTELIRGFVSSLAIGALLGVLGPFGTFERIPTVERLTFWIACIFGGWFIQAPLYWLGDWIGRERHVPAWIWVPLGAVIGAAPMTILVNGTAVTLLRVTATDSFSQLYPMVLAVTMAIQVFSHFMIGQRAHREALVKPPTPHPPRQEPAAAPAPVSPLPIPSDAATPVAANSFFERLPPRLGRDLICLRMEDHYLRVHTSAGDAMILMKIGDAELELAAIEGMRVHRSWWVARQAVTGWSRDGKTLTLTLRNGLAAPVARERQAKLREAGWVD